MPYNKHLRFLAGHVGFMTKNLLVDKLLLQMNDIWRNRNLEDYKQLVTENPE